MAAIVDILCPKTLKEGYVRVAKATDGDTSWYEIKHVKIHN